MQQLLIGYVSVIEYTSTDSTLTRTYRYNHTRHHAQDRRTYSVDESLLSHRTDMVVLVVRVYSPHCQMTYTYFEGVPQEDIDADELISPSKIEGRISSSTSE